MLKGYGQFCPVALAAEIFAERWTPLIIRELLCGSRRFSDLVRGVPRMSRTLLAQRLKSLERAGLVERIPGPAVRGLEYALTPAGEDLRPVVVALGVWGQRWVRTEVKKEHADPELLMWDIHRRLHMDRLPERRTVVLFEFEDARPELRRIWLVLDRSGVDVCYVDEGLTEDLTARTDVRTLTAVWMGDIAIEEAIRSEKIRLEGPVSLARAFPTWLQLSSFASVERRAVGARSR
jgi:DNA-binding HxlR family transcriptional regulator